MRILFVHQNFPGQYKHLAPALAAEPGNTVVALHLGRDTRWGAIRVAGYQVAPQPAVRGVHPWLRDLNVKMLRAEAAGRRASNNPPAKPGAFVCEPLKAAMRGR